MECFSALVLCQDDDALRVIGRALEEYRLEARVAPTVREANEWAKARRFDLALCDYDLVETNQLTYLRPESTWRGMFLALLRQQQFDAIQGRRIHLRLPKPLTYGMICRGLRAVYTPMSNERRTSFRYPVEIDATRAELMEGGKPLALPFARIMNVSRGGMSVRTREALPERAVLRVSVQLPESKSVIQLDGRIVWTKSSGISGVKLGHLAESSAKTLAEWLEARMPPEFNWQ